jgi:hypothetical protein
MTKTKESIKYENVTACALYATNLNTKSGKEKKRHMENDAGPAWRFI